MFTDCSDAMHRGGIVPNPGQPVSILIKVCFTLFFKEEIMIFKIVFFQHFIILFSFLLSHRMMTPTLPKNATWKILTKRVLLVLMDGLDEGEMDNAFKYIEVLQLKMRKLLGKIWLLIK